MSQLVLRATGVFGRHWRLQQDNELRPKSGITKIFVGEEVSKWVEWPSNSADWNLIENFQNVIKRRVEKRKPENIDELEQHMNEKMRKTKKTS